MLLYALLVNMITWLFLVSWCGGCIVIYSCEFHIFSHVKLLYLHT